MRPQGTAFADSAKARDSVMCLGSIAALQYYFARTGLLDGKGAQMAKETKTGAEKTSRAETGVLDDESDSDAFDQIMSAPAVSTYRHKELVIEPLPDLRSLRRHLRDALNVAQKTLDTREHVYKATEPATSVSANRATAAEEVQGWHEVQGLNIIDVVTLSIRQARTYYVSHTQPHMLYALKSEREIRSDLYQVLDVLKRMAGREFRGGMRANERDDIASWIRGIQDLLSDEERQEKEDFERIHRSPWRSGDWTGREREREWLFLRSFDKDPSPLPPWDTGVENPSDFLLALSKGLRLINLHNEMVRRSRRPFGEITTFYTDLTKPYRCAENLRYWAKAAELRWEIKLEFNALDVVHGDSDQAWLHFERAIETWCRRVREELSRDWATNEHARQQSRAAITLATLDSEPQGALPIRGSEDKVNAVC